MSGMFSSGDDPKRPSATRIGIWVVVSCVGAYFLISGLIGVINNGG
ncbi:MULTISPECIES: hypothetical protein [unclassified Microbacterium]